MLPHFSVVRVSSGAPEQTLKHVRLSYVPDVAHGILHFGQLHYPKDSSFFTEERVLKASSSSMRQTSNCSPHRKRR